MTSFKSNFNIFLTVGYTSFLEKEKSSVTMMYVICTALDGILKSFH